MKKRNKLTILSILTSAVIMTSSVPVDTTTNSFVSSYYNVLIDDIIEEYTYVSDKVNFVPYSNYIPQGIAIMNDYILVTNYDYYKDKNSVVCVYDMDGNLVNKCVLGNKAHVGGITYDKDNDLVWVTSYCGMIDAYNSSDLLEYEEITPVYKDILVGKGLTNYRYPWLDTASFLSYYNGYLYVGNFSLSNQGIVKRYTININEDKVTLKYIDSFNIPDMVQGITFYKKDEKEYILFSRSYGKDSSSVLQMFSYSEDIRDYRDTELVSVTYKMGPMLEQIIVDGTNLYTLFESNAKPYKIIQDKDFDSVPVLDTDEMVKRLELKIDTN